MSWSGKPNNPYIDPRTRQWQNGFDTGYDGREYGGPDCTAEYKEGWQVGRQYLLSALHRSTFNSVSGVNPLTGERE